MIRDELARMEVLAMLAATVGLMVLALVRPAPLGEMADPLMAPAHVSAPWIFAWIQELLRYLPALAGGVLIPLALFFVIMALPFLKVERTEEGVQTVGKRGLPLLFLSAVLLFAAVFTLIHFFR